MTRFRFGTSLGSLEKVFKTLAANCSWNYSESEDLHVFLVDVFEAMSITCHDFYLFSFGVLPAESPIPVDLGNSPLFITPPVSNLGNGNQLKAPMKVKKVRQSIKNCLV